MPMMQVRVNVLNAEKGQKQVSQVFDEWTEGLDEYGPVSQLLTDLLWLCADDATQSYESQDVHMRCLCCCSICWVLKEI